MDVAEVFDRLGEAGVAVWLDEEANLRIDKDASAELKQLVRQHRVEVVAIINARTVMNRSRMRIVKLPLGGFALAKPPGPLPEEVVRAIKVLGMDAMPIVINDEECEWLPYREWVRRQVLDFSKPLCDPGELEEWRRKQEAEKELKRNGRRSR